MGSKFKEVSETDGPGMPVVFFLSLSFDRFSAPIFVSFVLFIKAKQDYLTVQHSCSILMFSGECRDYQEIKVQEQVRYSDP